MSGIYEPYPYRIQKFRLAVLLILTAAGIAGLVWLRKSPIQIPDIDMYLFAVKVASFILLPIAIGISMRSYKIGYERDFIYACTAIILWPLFYFLRSGVDHFIIPESALVLNFQGFFGELPFIGLMMLLTATQSGKTYAMSVRNRYIVLIPLMFIVLSVLFQFVTVYLLSSVTMSFPQLNIIINGAIAVVLLGISFFVFYNKYEKTAYRIYFWLLSLCMMIFMMTLYQLGNDTKSPVIVLGEYVWYIAALITLFWAGYEVHTRLVHGEVDVRKSLENTLFQAEQNLSLFRSLLEQIHVGVFTIDDKGNISYANPHLSALRGKSIEKIIGADVKVLFDPINLEKFLLDQEKWKDGAPTQNQVELLTAQKNIPVLINSTPIRDRVGQFRGSHHVIIEYSDRKDYEQRIKDYSSALKKQIEDQSRQLSATKDEMQQSKNYYETLIDGMLDILLVINTNGRCVFVNQYGKQLLGYDIDGLNNKRLPDFLADLNKLQSNYGESMKIELRDYETKMQTRQGKSLVISWNIRFLYGTKDEKIGVMCVGRDISEYKALQGKLQDHSDNLEQLVQQRTDELDRKIDQLAQILKIGESILLDTDLNRILSNICRAICKTGWKVSIITLKSQDNKIQIAASSGIQRPNLPQFIDKRDELFRQTIRFMKDEFRIGNSFYIDPRNVNFMTHTIDDTLSPTQVWAKDACLLSPIKLKNRVLGFIFVFDPNDQLIPDEKKLQLIEILTQKAAVAIENKQLFEELQSRAQELEIANERQSQYFANMSHELRTPLNSVLSLASILQQSGNKFTSDQKQHIDVIRKNGERLLNLINNILDLSKIDAGKMQVQHSFFALRDLLQLNIDTIRPLCNQKQLKLDLNITKNVPQYIFSDQHKLEMVLTNILSNAVKFTQKGKISVDVKTSDRGKMLDFYIKDTGIGLTAEEVQTMFQPFRQTGDQQEHQKYGTGLGLSISKHIWQLLGGEIFVSSKKDKGTQFHLTLPIIETEPGVEMKPQQPAIMLKETRDSAGNSNHSNAKILLVDDNQDNQYALKYILEDQGFQIDFASNGKEAISMANSIKPDMILMDMMMPGMDGYEATQRLRKQREFRTIPIIAMTAKTKDEDKGKAIENGCNDYLSKPFTFDDVLKKVNQWIGEAS
ncbi:response regulator [candidate division KSB1 bacterium]|nr:response regulator [candidate division KSB1 bacterium]